MENSTMRNLKTKEVNFRFNWHAFETDTLVSTIRNHVVYSSDFDKDEPFSIHIEWTSDPDSSMRQPPDRFIVTLRQTTYED